MLDWYFKLFKKGPADADRSLLGCFVANALVFAVLALIYWLFRTPLAGR